MGNKQQRKTDVTQYDNQEWTHVGTHRSIYQVVQSSKGKGQAQAQILHFDPKLDIESEIAIYQYRKDQDNALVKCIAVHAEKSESKSLCGNKQTLKVLTQRIPLRLNELPQLTFAQSLYVLSQSLRGYQDCYNKLGPFQITEEMIGINEEGNIKVWVNPEFAENHPLTQKPLLFTSGIHRNDVRVENLSVNKDQVEMIHNIIRVVQTKSEFGKFSEDFSNRISKNSTSFSLAFKEIESYANQKKIFIPDRIINTRADYKKVGKYFTPGDQYERDENDPFFRRKIIREGRDNQLRYQSFQREGPVLESGTLKNHPPQLPEPISHNSHINSPMLSFHQQQGPTRVQPSEIFLQSRMGRRNQLYSNLTFYNNVIGPQISTLVFNSQSCMHPHKKNYYFYMFNQTHLKRV